MQTPNSNISQNKKIKLDFKNSKYARAEEKIYS